MNYQDGNGIRRSQMNASIGQDSNYRNDLGSPHFAIKSQIGQDSNYRNDLGGQHFAVKSQVNNQPQQIRQDSNYRNDLGRQHFAVESQVNSQPQPSRQGSHALNSQINSPSYEAQKAQTGSSQQHLMASNLQRRSLGLTNAAHRKKTSPFFHVTNEGPELQKELNFTSNNFNFENITQLKSGMKENDLDAWIRNLPNSSNQSSPRSPLSALECYGDSEVNQRIRNHRNLSDQLSPAPAPATVQCPYCGDGVLMTEEAFSDHLRDFHRHRFNTCTLPLHHHLSPSEMVNLNLPKPKCSGCGEEREDYSAAYRCNMGHRKEREERKRKREEESMIEGEGKGAEVESEIGQVEEKFICPHEGCTAELPNAASLQQHRLRRHNFRVKPAKTVPTIPKCDFCLMEFSRPGSIKRHLAICKKNPANTVKNTKPEILKPPSPVHTTHMQNQNQNQSYQAYNQDYSPQNHNSIQMQAYQTHPSNSTSMHNHHPNTPGPSNHTPTLSSLSNLPSSQGSYSSVLTIDSNCGLIS